MVDSADELQPSGLKASARVGLTAGASAPEMLVQQVIERIWRLGAVSVRKMDGIRGNRQVPAAQGLRADS
jgi:4-hydroxy-3-methylbut-2-enyl diphosphate reductase